MDVELRQPSPADAERLGRMHYGSCQDAYSSFLPPEFWGEATEQRWISSWVKDLQSLQPGSATWIALRDGQILGFATAGPARPNPTAGTPVRERELWSIYVRAGEYGSGLADRLLETVLPQRAPAALWVFEANERARRFYSRRGFEPDGASPNTRPTGRISRKATAPASFRTATPGRSARASACASVSPCFRRPIAEPARD
jgi:GNAT superfamily N-acetyltransferase